jgi:hypothetical protein
MLIVAFGANNTLANGGGNGRLTVETKTNGAIITLPATVELAMTIASLSQLINKESILKLDSEYARAISAYSTRHKKHPIFAVLGNDFNLPRLAGNAADFTFDQQGKLVEVDSSGSIWRDAKGDLFRKHQRLLEDFATQSNYLAFYQKHRLFSPKALMRPS